MKLVLLPDKKRKQQSRIHRRTSNPNFYEDFVFSVAPDDLERRTLRFTVCDFDRFSRQQTIGHVMYQLKGVDLDMDGQETDDIWVDINEDETAKVGGAGGFSFITASLSTASSRCAFQAFPSSSLRVTLHNSRVSKWLRYGFPVFRCGFVTRLHAFRFAFFTTHFEHLVLVWLQFCNRFPMSSLRISGDSLRIQAFHSSGSATRLQVPAFPPTS